jgi:hypothetical protein
MTDARSSHLQQAPGVGHVLVQLEDGGLAVATGAQLTHLGHKRLGIAWIAGQTRVVDGVGRRHEPMTLGLPHDGAALVRGHGRFPGSHAGEEHVVGHAPRRALGGYHLGKTVRLTLPARTEVQRQSRHTELRIFVGVVEQFREFHLGTLEHRLVRRRGHDDEIRVFAPLGMLFQKTVDVGAGHARFDFAPLL